MSGRVNKKLRKLALAANWKRKKAARWWHKMPWNERSLQSVVQTTAGIIAEKEKQANRG